MTLVTKRAVAVVAGVAVVSAWLGESWLRHRAQHRYHEAQQARKQLELQLIDVKAERERLASVLTDEQQRVEQLSITLSAKDAQLQQVITRLAEEDQLVEGLQQKLAAMQSQLDRMQGELAVSREPRKPSASSRRKGAVELERVIVSHPSPAGQGLQGRVVSVHPEWHFIVIDFGWDTVNIGDIISIYRNNELLAKARVERVQEEVSAATLLPETGSVEIQVDDVVRIL